MPRPAEFEEKEYEHLLVAAISRGSQSWWGPGQVLERWLGFDLVLYGTMKIWQELGYLEPVGRGIYLRDLLDMPPRISKVPQGRLPTFRVNLFLQAKRPELLLRTKLTVRAKGINRECFRFRIDGRQQRRLVSMTDKLKGSGLVAYVAPAFCESRELNNSRVAGDVFARSNSVSALRMKGHEYWLYNGPGQQGVGDSEPEGIEEPSLASRLESLARDYVSNDSPELEMVKNLQLLAESVIEREREVGSKDIWSMLLKKHGEMATSRRPSLAEETIFWATIMNDYCSAHRIVWGVYA